MFQKKLENLFDIYWIYLLIHSIMWDSILDLLIEVYWRTFIDKCLLGSENLFSSNEHKDNDKIILKYFYYNLNKLNNWKSIVIFAINMENLKKLKYIKPLSPSIVYSKYSHEYTKIFKEG